MTNKPVITKEQYEAISTAIYLHGENYVVDQHCLKQKNRVLWCGTLDPLNDIEMWVLAKCVYTSDYEVEVEPEFKEGDFVVYKQNGTIWKIEESINNGAAYHLHNGSGYFSGVNYYSLRHATEQEIQQEKERRFWHGNGREVWYLKKGDLLTNDEYQGFTVQNVKFKEVRFFGNPYREHIDSVKERYSVSCFAENRLDGGKHD